MRVVPRVFLLGRHNAARLVHRLERRILSRNSGRGSDGIDEQTKKKQVNFEWTFIHEMFINTIRLADSNEIQISRQKDLFPCNETIETFMSNEWNYEIQNIYVS